MRRAQETASVPAPGGRRCRCRSERPLRRRLSRTAAGRMPAPHRRHAPVPAGLQTRVVNSSPGWRVGGPAGTVQQTTNGRSRMNPLLPLSTAQRHRLPSHGAGFLACGRSHRCTSGATFSRIQRFCRLCGLAGDLAGREARKQVGREVVRELTDDGAYRCRNRFHPPHFPSQTIMFRSQRETSRFCT